MSKDKPGKIKPPTHSSTWGNCLLHLCEILNFQNRCLEKDHSRLTISKESRRDALYLLQSIDLHGFPTCAQHYEQPREQQLQQMQVQPLHWEWTVCFRKHPKHLHLLTASPIGSLSLSNKRTTFLHLPHSILSQTDVMTALYFLRMAPFNFYIQKPLLHLRRLLHKQEPQHGLEPGGGGEDPLASLRTRLA